jgi:hypothetical protein
MNHKFLKPRQALNKAFLKVKPLRKQIGIIKWNLGVLSLILGNGFMLEEIKIVEGGKG